MLEILIMSNKNIKREDVLKLVRPYCRKDLIKVLVGQRRSGKSYVLDQIQNLLTEEFKVAAKSILYINKELRKFDFIREGNDLLDYIEEVKLKKKVSAVFIDEIQDIENFEKALRDLQALGMDIYCTGSNAKMLSSDLATLLSGRYIEINVYPLKYSEFLTFHNLNAGNDALFKYFRYGGLPYLIHLEFEDEIIYGYLKSVYNTIILKDVVQRFNVRNVDFLNRLVMFLADNTGSLFSANNISDYLKSQRINISVNVVLNYLDHLVAANFIMPVKRLDLKGKKIFSVGEKFYFTDLGLRHSIHKYNLKSDINKVLENVVCNHLKALGYSVSIGEINGKEIDFVCEKGDDIKYVQVAYLISDEKVAEREFGNLLAIKDNYEKYVISTDEFIDGNWQGIKHLHIGDFLLDNAF